MTAFPSNGAPATWRDGQPPPERRAALEALVAGAQRAESDALAVARDGRLLLASDDAALEALRQVRSITKSIVALALGQLVDSGAIPSLEEPLTTWFPRLRGPKADIRLVHLLTHTSGLSPESVPTFPGAEAYLADSTLNTAPGTAYAYSNAPVDLLADITAHATGRTLAEHVAATLLRPLGIEEWSWQERPDGEVHAAYGMRLSARSLLRVGELVAGGGVWRGRRLVPARWLEALERPALPANPSYSLLWYLRAGSSAAPPTAIYADGWCGQRLAVYAGSGVVAVRLREQAPADEQERERTAMPDLLDLVEAAFPPV